MGARGGGQMDNGLTNTRAQGLYDPRDPRGVLLLKLFS